MLTDILLSADADTVDAYCATHRNAAILCDDRFWKRKYVATYEFMNPSVPAGWSWRKAYRWMELKESIPIRKWINGLIAPGRMSVLDKIKADLVIKHLLGMRVDLERTTENDAANADAILRDFVDYVEAISDTESCEGGRLSNTLLRILHQAEAIKRRIQRYL